LICLVETKRISIEQIKKAIDLLSKVTPEQLAFVREKHWL
jgi:hypothetical protein